RNPSSTSSSSPLGRLLPRARDLGRRRRGAHGRRRPAALDKAGQTHDCSADGRSRIGMSRKQNPYAGQDPRTLEARKRGYPARSVFKLEEIQQKTQLLRGGQRVLDLGAAPGSWSLYAAQKVGPSGRVLAIDLSEI